MQPSDYFFLFGAASIVLGIMGYMRSQSVASLFAGGVSGILLAVAAVVAARQEGTSGVNWGYVTGLVVSLLLLGRFLPLFLKSRKFYPAGLMAALSALGIAAGILGLAH
jgi:uncharacterized membrane protein (UPF0136 family)